MAQLQCGHWPLLEHRRNEQPRASVRCYGMQFWNKQIWQDMQQKSKKPRKACNGWKWHLFASEAFLQKVDVTWSKGRFINKQNKRSPQTHSKCNKAWVRWCQKGCDYVENYVRRENRITNILFNWFLTDFPKATLAHNKNNQIVGWDGISLGEDFQSKNKTIWVSVR